MARRVNTSGYKALTPLRDNPVHTGVHDRIEQAGLVQGAGIYIPCHAVGYHHHIPLSLCYAVGGGGSGVVV